MHRRRALIIFGGWEGHRPQETAAFLAQGLESNDFEVELCPTLEILEEAAQLARYDLLVPHWTQGDLRSVQEANLVSAVKGGAGLAGIHGGMGDAFRLSSVFHFMVGGQFVAHPDDFIDYKVTLIPGDPLTQGLDDFWIRSERYYMHVDPANHVLATTEVSSATAPWIDGVTMPVVWKKRFGQGRVFYSSLGHGLEELSHPTVRELTRRGLIWAGS